MIYAQSHEGRGIGIVNKIRAYELQDRGLDTVDANTALGFDVDERSFDDIGRILLGLGLTSIRLLTNNPVKVSVLASCGVRVDQQPMPHFRNPHNAAYLDTKQFRLGHLAAVPT